MPQQCTRPGASCRLAWLLLALAALLYVSPARHRAFSFGQPARRKVANPLLQRAAPGRSSLVPRRAGGRDEVKASLFSCLDADGDGHLNRNEMLLFAECTGFEGSPDEWTEEYRYICESLGCGALQGLDFPAFSRMVDDDSDEGCYCSDEELAEMLTESGGVAASSAPAVPSATPRRAARGTASPEYFASERKQGIYAETWKEWDPREGLSARSPRVGSIPGMDGVSSTATQQEAAMFLYDQVQSGIFGDAGASVQESLSQCLGLPAGDSGWFDLRVDENVVDEKELATLVLSPEGWPGEKATIPNGYMMHILSVGRGVKSTLCGRENNHIINALHRDVSKCGQLCDTCLCGVVGRKRVILFAPDEFRETAGFARKPDHTSHDLHTFQNLSEQEAWRRMEELASKPDVMGGVTTLEPGRFVFIPHGWWHAVQPVDGFTFITGPSHLSGLSASTG